MRIFKRMLRAFSKLQRACDANSLGKKMRKQKHLFTYFKIFGSLVTYVKKKNNFIFV